MFETKFSGNNKIWGALPPRLQACPTFLGDFWSRGLLKILGWRVSHARCTTNGMCAKNSTYIQVARTSIITITHFTLHYRIWRVIGLTRERFVALGLPSWTHLQTRYWGVFTLQGIRRFASCDWSTVLRKLGKRLKWKGESWFHYRNVLFVGAVGIAETWFYLA